MSSKHQPRSKPTLKMRISHRYFIKLRTENEILRYENYVLKTAMRSIVRVLKNTEDVWKH